MHLISKHKLNLSTKDKNSTIVIMKECGRLWNDLIHIYTNQYNIDKTYLTAFELQKTVQGKYSIHSDILIALCQRISSNIKTSLNLRKQGFKNIVLPYKIKEKVTITGKERQFLKNNYLALSKDIRIKIPDSVPHSSYFHIVKRKNEFYIYATNEVECKTRVKSNVVCGVDLGEIHSISSIDTDGNKCIFSGRELRSFKRQRNRIYKNTKRRQSNLKVGSKLHRKLEKVRDRTSEKTKNKNRNFLHHVTKKFIDKCKENNVSRVIVGECKGVGQRTKGKINKLNRERLSQFEHGELRRLLEYKCELNGIEYLGVEESWTTKTCPACGSINTPRGREYKCSDCAFKAHRDIVGSFNILRKRMNVDIKVLEGGIRGILSVVCVPKRVSESNFSRSIGLVPSEMMLLNST